MGQEQLGPPRLEGVVQGEDRAQPVDGGAAQVGHDPVEFGIEGVQPLGHHLAQHVGLGREAGEDAAHGDAGLPRDLADGGLFVAHRLEQIARGFEHAPPGRLLLGLAYVQTSPQARSGDASCN